MERMTRIETWSYCEKVLQNTEVAEKGHVACVDRASGEIVAGQTGTGLIPIGTFEQNLTGNGTKKVRIKLFKEVILHRFDNDSAPNALDASDFLGECWLKDSKTVSALSTGRSLGGRVWDVTTAGVLIEPAISLGIQGEPGA